jgi:hypothetical protein
VERVKRKIVSKSQMIPEQFHASIRELIRTHANGGNLTAEEIRSVIGRAIADPSVKEIIFDDGFPPRVIRRKT